MPKLKPNLIILGASGGVARAMLQLLPKYRAKFSSLILSDRNNNVLHDKHIDHKKLNYEFILFEFTDETIQEFIQKLNKKYKSAIVLDMTDCPTLPILSAVDSVGFNYMNCSLNLPEGRTLINFVDDMNSFADRFKNGIHVLSNGMNPGVINHLVKKGVVEHGIPNEIIEMEYESGAPKIDSGKPFTTWSKVQFLTESVRWNSGHCDSRGVYVETKKNAVNTLIDTKKYLEPIKKLEKYPKGMTVAHDEIIAMCRIMEVPGRFIYAIHPTALKRLKNLVGSKREVEEKDIIFEDNILVPLDGSDYIGIWLMYDTKDICYYVEVEHSSVKGTNATLMMVAIGVLAGLIGFIDDSLKHRGAYSVGDLNTDNFLKIVSNYMKIKTKVVNKKHK